jgi:DNA-binding beta-propeller fold protein YncE
MTTIPLDRPVRHIAECPHRHRLLATTQTSVIAIEPDHGVVTSAPVGIEPKAILVSPDGSRAFVTGYEGAVSIVNTDNLTVKTVSREPSSAEAVDPQGNYLYQVHNQGRNCWLSAMTEHGITATVVPVDSYAVGLAVSPSGDRVYVASSKARSHRTCGHGSISIIDTETFTLLDVMPMEFAPDTIVVSSDGSTLHATHYNANAITTIELTKRSQTLIGLEDAPLGIVTSPAGDRLYVSGLHSLTLLDPATHAVTKVLTGDLPRYVRVGGAGLRACVTDLRHNCVWLLDAVSAAVITTVALDRSPTAVGLSADERFIYLADDSTPVLTVIEPASSTGSGAKPGG